MNCIPFEANGISTRKNRTHGGDFMRVSAASWDPYPGHAPDSQDVSLRFENKAKWLSVLIMRFSVISMTIYGSVIVYRMGFAHRLMKWLPLKADFTGIEEETPCPHERSLQSWVLIDLSVPAIWGVNWASLLLFRDVYTMFMARSVDVEKVSFSCALHLGPLCFYQRFMSKSGFTVKLTSEPLVARSPSKSLQRALKMCHMVMWFCKIGKNKLVLWVIFKELCPPKL